MSAVLEFLRSPEFSGFLSTFSAGALAGALASLACCNIIERLDRRKQRRRKLQHPFLF